MQRVDVDEAKTELCNLLDQAAAGEDVIIVRQGRPVARLVPYAHPGSVSVRRPGAWRGRVRIADDFDLPCREI